MVAFGGPNIVIDTTKGAVEGWRGGSHLEMRLNDKVIEAIDNYAEDIVYLAFENHRRITPGYEEYIGR